MVANRGLECTLYHMLGENLPYSTHDQTLKEAESWGLPVSDNRKICNTIEEIEEWKEKYPVVSEKHYNDSQELANVYAFIKELINNGKKEV